MEAQEKELLQLLKKGEVKSFEFIFRFYYEPLLAYASGILKDEAEAEEVVQELFLKIWRDREKLEVKHALKAYLYRAVYHMCLHRMEKIKHGKAYRQYAMQQPVTHIHEDERLHYAELARIVFDGMKSMPQRRQAIFKLSRFHGLTYREIAEKLSISVKTVEDNMSKALRFFRQKIKAYDE